MSLDIKTLAMDTLASASSLSSTHKLYQPTTTVPKQTAIVHSMRFTNKLTSGSVQIQVYFLKYGDTLSTAARRVLPKNLTIPAGHTYLDDDQLTLGSGDAIYAYADTASAIDYLLSGSERPE